MEPNPDLKITLIGAGTIGLSFAAFHLNHLPSPSHLTIFDTRPDAARHVFENLPKFYSSSDTLPNLFEIKVVDSLEDAVKDADIIQESGPENLPFKQELWREVEKYAKKDGLLWSSTSGIPASQQCQDMVDRSRLLVVHPYNPPHIMPLLELVPSPSTSATVIERTRDFWAKRGRVPIHIKKEVTGFVANRLAFALLRESIHLVNEGVVTVKELDEIVQSSMGPRWAVAGPFKSYHAGGGPGGLEGFFANIGGTVQDCWTDSGQVNVGDGWEGKVFSEAKEAYGVVDTAERDTITRRVLEVIDEEKANKKV
ncbi:hypothetical protein BDV96DRAFT_493430 [Lophiotrema nucula]|uniref:L-gulonate 3-dehydrogenase n=1 Tax=Lophiotrema nucula TaxID=690887 RepID=A0A6A5Z823_9PLEO|nr:hypothetical protein BDV96DRAFT_493430 [Lophiotrema nucula]